LRSVTTVSPDATLADALSTAIMVLGPARGLALAESLGVGAVLVDDAGHVSMTPDLEGHLVERHPPRDAAL
jgi:thiamine biosynthesis lipoprotein